MLDIDCSKLPKELSDDIFNHVEKRLTDEELFQVKIARHSQFIIVNADNRFLYGQLIALTKGHLRKQLFNEYHDKYSKEEKEEFIQNGIEIEHTKYNNFT